MMRITRSALVSAAVLGVLTSGVALAQTTAPPSSTSSKVDDVSKWASKQWNRAKAKWAEEKEKWADCQKQSENQNLTGRKSWSFLASCMTTSSTAAFTAGPGSSFPLLATLPLHRDAGWIAYLDPARARAGPIGAVDSLGDYALGTKPAGVREHDRAILSNMFVEQDARRRIAQQSR